jgi:hypothetical protein
METEFSLQDVVLNKNRMMGNVQKHNNCIYPLCLFQAKPVNKDRFISKMFLRGDSVIVVLRNPLATAGAK